VSGEQMLCHRIPATGSSRLGVEYILKRMWQRQTASRGTAAVYALIAILVCVPLLSANCLSDLNGHTTHATFTSPHNRQMTIVTAVPSALAATYLL